MFSQRFVDLDVGYLKSFLFTLVCFIMLYLLFVILLQILTKHSRSLTLNLYSQNGIGGSRNLGTVTVHAEETIASRNAVELVLRCSHLENKDLLSKSVSIYDVTFFLTSL